MENGPFEDVFPIKNGCDHRDALRNQIAPHGSMLLMVWGCLQFQITQPPNHPAPNTMTSSRRAQHPTPKRWVSKGAYKQPTRR